ncbi:MAG TPA: endolytic transglycosylase MltG [Candidatus Paceibacterota bacterium]|jgi:UPF0755 protein
MAGLRRPPILIASLIAVLLFAVLIYSHLFGPTQEFAKTEQFIVTPGTTLAEVAADLRTQGFVQSTLLARMVLSSGADEKGIRAGGYAIGKHMDLWTISKTLSAMPRLVFVSIPPSVRKEEIGAILAQELFWGDEELALWEAATVTDPDMLEGVYYPDTYLIPTDQAPVAIAARLRGRFADVFAPYAAEAKEKGLSWKEVLTLASLVDREAGRDDKELVAGILWNRLELGMRLQVDATLQYIRGTEGKWWPVPRSEDKYLNSPFNTYKHAGLPPHPINNPSVASVAAVLNAQSTDCVFYLHDPDGQIHCSLTYSGQQENVDRYLR